MKRILLGALLVLFVVSASFAEGVVSMTSDPWPPFADPSHPHGGLSVDIARAAFKTQGYDVTMEFMPWARVLESTRVGDFDLVIGAWMSQERSEVFLYSEPFIVNEIRFIKRKGDPFEYSGLEGLPGMRIGVIRGYSYSPEFESFPGLVLDPTTEFITNIRKLIAGRIDLTLEDEIVARNALSIMAPDMVESIAFTGPPLASNPLYAMSGRQNPRHEEIIGAFNKGLETIRADGTYDRILASYGLK